MTREFSVESLVALPRLSVDSGLALWQALRAAVEAEKKLPKFLTPSWQQVEALGGALALAARTRLSETGKSQSSNRRQADLVVDNAVGALDQFLAAWERLPDSLWESQLAASTRQALFPDGTGFLKLSFEQEWAQVERRIALGKSEGLDKNIDKLGGGAFWKHLMAAQTAYGKVLGLTAVPAPPAETVGLRDPLEALVAALRLYVIKVTAHRDEAAPETLALSDRLLRPLASWVSKAPKSAEAEPAPVPLSEPAAPAHA